MQNKCWFIFLNQGAAVWYNLCEKYIIQAKQSGALSFRFLMVSMSLAQIVCLKPVLVFDPQLSETCAAVNNNPGNLNHCTTSEPRTGVKFILLHLQFSGHVWQARLMRTQPEEKWMGCDMKIYEKEERNDNRANK